MVVPFSTSCAIRPEAGKSGVVIKAGVRGLIGLARHQIHLLSHYLGLLSLALRLGRDSSTSIADSLSDRKSLPTPLR